VANGTRGRLVTAGAGRTGSAAASGRTRVAGRGAAGDGERCQRERHKDTRSRNDTEWFHTLSPIPCRMVADGPRPYRRVVLPHNVRNKPPRPACPGFAQHGPARTARRRMAAREMSGATETKRGKEAFYSAPLQIMLPQVPTSQCFPLRSLARFVTQRYDDQLSDASRRASRYSGPRPLTPTRFSPKRVESRRATVLLT